jgi:hypothetical protein
VIPDLAAVCDTLTQRMKAAAIYHCGPFDEAGDAASPDIHILAIADIESVTDLHLIPDLSRFPRRIEVSVIPQARLEEAARQGISDWLMFYTLDKMRRGRPLMESGRIKDLREQGGSGVSIKPSLYAGLMRHLLNLLRTMDREEEPLALQAMRVNMLVMMTLSLYSIVRLGQTFSKSSEVLRDKHPLVKETAGEAPRSRAREILSYSKRLLQPALARLGYARDLAAVTDRP